MPEQLDGLVFDYNSNIGTEIYANIPRSGQLGLGPHIPEIDGATPLVMPFVTPIIVHTPSMFRWLPEMDVLCKALIERHCKTIDGVTLQYDVDTQGTPIGYDSQQILMPVQTKRPQIQPTFTFQELTGNLVWNFYRTWIELMKNADTQAAFTATAVHNSNERIDPQLLSTISMDILWLQYDTTRRPDNLLDAWFTVGMFPLSTTDFGTRKEAGGNEGFPERAIQFTSILQHNKNTRWIGQEIANILAMHRVDYELAVPAHEEIASRLLDMGVQEEINDARRDFVPVGPVLSGE